MSKNQKQKKQNKEKAQSAELRWTEAAWNDYIYWQENNPAVLDSINSLIEECLDTPFQGKGKPEPLKANLTGFWSRRITREHRLVYLPHENAITIVSCRFHYENL